MEKSTIEEFINFLKEIGITNYVIRIEGGNRFIQADSEDSKIILKDDVIVSVEKSLNYGYNKGRFIVRYIPYDNINTIAAGDLTAKETLELLESAGALTDEVKNMIKATGAKVQIHPQKENTSAYGEIYKVDEEGNKVTTIEGDEPGRVTTGFNK